MAVKASCFVTTCNNEGPAFAVRADNDEAVYIPAAIADALELSELDEIEAVMVRSEKGSTAWRVVRARITEASE